MRCELRQACRAATRRYLGDRGAAWIETWYLHRPRPTPMLSENDIREQLSIAYIHAVASRAGYAWEPTNVDRDGIDGRVMARGVVVANASIRSPVIGFQLKGTTQITGSPDPIPFSLKQKNYDDLRGRCAEPRYLALLVMPPDPSQWLQLDGDALVLRRCMHWLSLARATSSSNSTTTTVQIPRGNLLDVTAMRRLVEAAACEEIL